jgi:hypothetical protein
LEVTQRRVCLEVEIWCSLFCFFSTTYTTPGKCVIMSRASNGNMPH